MLEIETYNEKVTCFKTGSEFHGNVVMWSYAYLLEDALFDAGCANARDELKKALQEYDVKRVFISHTHEDHIGACSILEDDMTIFATPAVAEELRNPLQLTEFFDTVWGQPDPVTKIETMPSSFDVGDMHFEVIPLPGHHANMVGFFEPDKKWLFSADAVPVPSRKKIGMPDENIPEMIVTLERIYKLDLEILFDSHRGPIENPGEHIKTRIDFLKDFQAQVRELHSEGRSVEEIMEVLELEGPWYLELTKDRFGIDFVINSLIHDEPSSST
jgi:glyoxylase-like metal-dependent hydrolase (beta-lactamase superfamily II)